MVSQTPTQERQTQFFVAPDAQLSSGHTEEPQVLVRAVMLQRTLTHNSGTAWVASASKTHRQAHMSHSSPGPEPQPTTGPRLFASAPRVPATARRTLRL